MPGGGRPIDLVATLRTAAPWQKIRRRTPRSSNARLIVLPEDFRLKRLRHRSERALIFAVDASGSAAYARLAETKGAIELLLAEAYVHRHQVALIAFRGETAETLLPPTRSLVQAKRRLAALPGGGATPLASGLVASSDLAAQLRRQGLQTHIAVMTDGRGNVSLDGETDRTKASEDAEKAAKSMRGDGISSIVIDTGARPQDAARTLADNMGAIYMAMPRADAARLSRAVGGALMD
jgi:magnesium chelatase subunit D